VETSKYKNLLDKLKDINKTELHAHLGGAVPMDFIQKYSTDKEYIEITNMINKIRSGIDYSEGFKVFPLISKVLNTTERIREAAHDFCRKQYNDKVSVSELRTGLKKIGGKGFEEHLKAVLTGLESGMKDYNVKVPLVLSLRRDTSAEDAKEIVDLAIKYRQIGVLTGIDISGESTKGDASGIFEALKLARDNGLPITLHIGEHSSETAEQQMKELREIQPDRVGHAVHLCHEALLWVLENRIVVEACIMSAWSVGMINKPGEHPALELFRKGHPVVFCTDDSTLFGDLSEELALVACLCDLSIEQVIGMQLQAINHLFS